MKKTWKWLRDKVDGVKRGSVFYLEKDEFVDMYNKLHGFCMRDGFTMKFDRSGNYTELVVLGSEYVSIYIPDYAIVIKYVPESSNKTTHVPYFEIHHITKDQILANKRRDLINAKLVAAEQNNQYDYLVDTLTP